MGTEDGDTNNVNEDTGTKEGAVSVSVAVACDAMEDDRSGVIVSVVATFCSSGLEIVGVCVVANQTGRNNIAAVKLPPRVRNRFEIHARFRVAVAVTAVHVERNVRRQKQDIIGRRRRRLVLRRRCCSSSKNTSIFLVKFCCDTRWSRRNCDGIKAAPIYYQLFYVEHEASDVKNVMKFSHLQFCKTGSRASKFSII